MSKPDKGSDNAILGGIAVFLLYSIISGCMDVIEHLILK
jgi:hypothetical protein